MPELLIKNATLIDGTGTVPCLADVWIDGGMIVRVERFPADRPEKENSAAGRTADRVIDARGLVLAPGFIDMHSHADLSLVSQPDAENLLGQGITTVFTGHCGMGMAPVGRYWKTQTDDLYALEADWPLASVSSLPGVTPMVPSAVMRDCMKKYYGLDMDWTTVSEFYARLEKQGIGVNMVPMVGLQQIRAHAVGLDMQRPATEAEIQVMKQLLEEAMEAGAAGLSVGYDYSPDKYASERELDELAAVVLKYDGMITAHTRNDREDDETFLPGDGIREFLELGRRTGVRVHISHIGPYAPFTRDDPEKIRESSEKVLAMLEDYRKQSVRVTWDVLHPEAASIFYEPQLCAPFQYYVLTCGGKQAFRRQLQDTRYRKTFEERIAKGEHIIFPRFTADSRITRCSIRAYEGRSLEEIATEAGKTVWAVTAEILAADVETCIRPRMPWEKLFLGDTFWKRDEATIGTDNMALHYDYSARRGDLPVSNGPSAAYNGFVLFLQKSAEAGIPLEKTIRKLTGNAADILRMQDRGYIRQGARADLVLFDPATLDAVRNFVETAQRPAGIEYVLVNGRIAVEHGIHSHIRSGRIIRANET